MDSSLFCAGVCVRTDQVNRDIRLVAYHPTVMPWRNVKHVPSLHLNHAAIIHRGRRASGNYHPYVLHRAALRSCHAPNVLRPFPSRFIRGASDGHSAKPYHLKFALFKRANLVGLLKSLQDYLEHGFFLSQPSANSPSTLDSMPPLTVSF